MDKECTHIELDDKFDQFMKDLGYKWDEEYGDYIGGYLEKHKFGDPDVMLILKKYGIWIHI
jgi:hypothetical protein